jgi:hypothetical protein
MVSAKVTLASIGIMNITADPDSAFIAASSCCLSSVFVEFLRTY